MKNIAIALSFLCLIYSANVQSPERNKAPIKTNVIDRAVELARGFQAEGPRAIATIAIAEAILHPKSGAASH